MLKKADARHRCVRFLRFSSVSSVLCAFNGFTASSPQPLKRRHLLTAVSMDFAVAGAYRSTSYS